jgi:hypothetical protein
LATLGDATQIGPILFVLPNDKASTILYVVPQKALPMYKAFKSQIPGKFLQLGLIFVSTEGVYLSGAPFRRCSLVQTLGLISKY